jgi:hypothetical protein
MDAAVHRSLWREAGPSWQNHDGSSVVPHAAEIWRMGYHAGDRSANAGGLPAWSEARPDGEPIDWQRKYGDHLASARRFRI